jgi:hypothetical protein
VPNPYLRDPKRWLAAGVLTVVVAALVIVLSLVWPTWGPFLVLPMVAIGIWLRIWLLRRRFRRDGIPPELDAWMAERAQRRRS